MIEKIVGVIQVNAGAVLSNVKSEGTGKLGAEMLRLEAGVLSQGT